MNKKYRSELSMVNHQSAEYLFSVGIIDADEMKEFDESCLVEEGETANAFEEPPETAPVTARPVRTAHTQA